MQGFGILHSIEERALIYRYVTHSVRSNPSVGTLISGGGGAGGFRGADFGCG